MRAYVLVRLHKGEEDLVKYMREKEHVERAEIVYGEYDVVIVVNVKNIHELSHLVLDDIRKRFDVERTSTLIVTD